MWTMGANVELDTRGDPAFPGNAVLLGTGWTGLQITPGLAGTRLPRINRYTSDARGYVRVYRQAVIAARAMYTAADATLPPYERLLLGGSSTLRGFRTGTFDGDRLFVTSAELRVPLTSVISGARLGVNAFMDAGKAWDFDGRLEDAVWHRGVGAGVFLLASVVRLNLSVARGLKDGDTRVHLSSGFSF
jgi:outer membrane protein assembly factor BamA